MVTMRQIDDARIVANWLLEKMRNARGYQVNFYRRDYEEQCLTIGKMLTEYHKELDMDEARKSALKQLDDTSRNKAIRNGENTFTLRAQDMTSPMVVVEWIRLNFETAPEEKLRQAFDIAIAMREHADRKRAD